jgi:hypothetical protein
LDSEIKVVAMDWTSGKQRGDRACMQNFGVGSPEDVHLDDQEEVEGYTEMGCRQRF